jgi:hypothetical protein
MISLDLHILDIVHNSITAGASQILIDISEDPVKDKFQIRVSDNGKGIHPEKLATITDPWTTSRKSRKVGLGLPLFKQNAEMAGGYLEITSQLNEGTQVTASFQHAHIDRPAIGDVAGVLVNLAAGFDKIHFIYTHTTQAGTYCFDTIEINETLDGVSLSNQEIRAFVKEMINENLDAINISR